MVRLVLHMELLLAGSRYPDEDRGTPADYVATVTAPSAILASLTVRTAVPARSIWAPARVSRRSGLPATAIESLLST